MCIVLLFKDCIHNTIYRRLKEFGNITPKNIKIRDSFRSNQNVKDSPHQLQLTQANVAAFVIVSVRSKFNEVRFLGISKPRFGCLVKTSDDML